MNKWADEQVIAVKEDRHAIGHSHIEIQIQVLERRPEQSFFSQAECLQYQHLRARGK